MYFEIDKTIFFILLLSAIPIVFLFLFLQRTFARPSLQVAGIERFTISKSWKSSFYKLPQYLFVLSLLLLAIALIDPRFYVKRENQIVPPGNLSVEGIALYIVLDQSGSMKEKVDVIGINGRREITTKIDLLKQAVKVFIQGDPKLGLSGRPNDLIGLVEFARAAQVIVPLTLDHKAIIDKLDKFDVVQDRTLDGTAIGYAIFKTANLIVNTRQYALDMIGKGKPAYEIKSSVILLVTDGLQDPNPLDDGKRWRQVSPLEAAQYAKDNNIRLYIVNVEPSLATAQYQPNLNQMKRAAESTGGQFYMLDKGSSLLKIYSAINALEGSAIPLSDQLKKDVESTVSKDQLPNIYQANLLYPYLLFAALAALFTAVVLETTVLRRFP